MMWVNLKTLAQITAEFLAGELQVIKSDTEPGRGEGIYLMTSWILPESIG